MNYRTLPLNELTQLYRTHTAAELAQKFDCTRTAMSEFLRRRGITKQKKN